MDVQNFEEDVIKASTEKPVVVDFWAPWCGPCRVLGPTIEKLAAEQADKWTLVKVNSDEHQDISARFGIRGIPAVKMFSGGEVVDEFTGALPEAAIRQWLEKALPSESRSRLSLAQDLIDNGEHEGAKDILKDILATEPTNPAASGLMAALIVFNQPDVARSLAEAARTGEPRISQIADAVIELVTLMEAVPTASGEPGSAQYWQAVSSLRSAETSKAIELLIEVLKNNRYLYDDAARRLGVAVFTLLGPLHPVTLAYRRTFDMWLY